MSYEIEYDAIALMFDHNHIQAALAAALGETARDLPYQYHHERVGACFILTGSNNCTTIRNGREVRARNWALPMVGTCTDIMRRVIRVAQFAETGGVTLTGRREVSPESYIRHYRRVLERSLRNEAAAAILAGNSITVEVKANILRDDPWAQYLQDNARLTLTESPQSMRIAFTDNPGDAGACLALIGCAMQALGPYPWASIWQHPMCDRLDRAAAHAKAVA